MNKKLLMVAGVICFLGIVALAVWFIRPPFTLKYAGEIALPSNFNNGFSTLLKKRRSVREFSSEALTLQDLSALLWSAQGITDKHGRRAAPSAGGLNPTTLYVSVSRVQGLKSGFYRYVPEQQALDLVGPEHFIKSFPKLAYDQKWIIEAPVVIVFAADHTITEKKYATAAKRLVSLEVGAAAENLALQAIDLKLATTMVGGFKQDKVKELLDIPQTPLLLMPVGHQK